MKRVLLLVALFGVVVLAVSAVWVVSAERREPGLKRLDASFQHRLPSNETINIRASQLSQSHDEHWITPPLGAWFVWDKVLKGIERPTCQGDTTPFVMVSPSREWVDAHPANAVDARLFATHEGNQRWQIRSQYRTLVGAWRSGNPYGAMVFVDCK